MDFRGEVWWTFHLADYLHVKSLNSNSSHYYSLQTLYQQAVAFNKTTFSNNELLGGWNVMLEEEPETADWSSHDEFDSFMCRYLV